MIFLGGLLVSCLATGYVFLRVLDDLYDRKYPQKKSVYIIFLLFHTIANMLIVVIACPILNIVYSFLIFFFQATLLYDAKKKTIFINSSMVIAYLAIIDLVATSAFSIIVNQTTIFVLENDLFFAISGIVNVLAILCTYNLFCERIKRCKVNYVSGYLHIYMIFLLILEMVILSYCLSRIENTKNNISLLGFGIGFVIVDIGFLHLIELISKNFELKQKAELLEQQKYLILKYYDEFQSQYEEAQKILHDVKKHIQVIEHLDFSQKTQKREYINELMQTINSSQRHFSCSDKIVCVILWEKIQICKSNNIKIDISMQDILFDFMDKIDVTSLFYNLLDNAIEACLECKRENPEMNLRIHRFKDYVVIKMCNTMKTLPEEKGGNLVSTKKSHMGLGISILMDLSNKYCGSFNYNYQNSIFETKIILSISNRIQKSLK